MNLVAGELVVFGSPQEGAYRDRATYQPGDLIMPEAWQLVHERQLITIRRKC